MGIVLLAMMLLAVAKAVGWIALSWWLILSPIWLVAGITIAIIIVVFIVVIVEIVKDELVNR